MVLNFLYIYNKKQKIQEKLCKSGKSKFITIREVEFLSRPLSSFLRILTKAIRKKAKRPLTYVTLCMGLFPLKVEFLTNMGVLVCIMALYGLIGKMMIENSHFQYINQVPSENFVKVIFSKKIFLAFLTIQTKK